MRLRLAALLALLVATSCFAATEGVDRQAVKYRPIAPFSAVMKPRTGSSYDTLFVARGDSNGTWTQRRPGAPITLVPGNASDTTGTNNSAAFRLFSTPIDVSGYSGGALEVVCTLVDSVKADSVLAELFPFGSASSATAGLVPIDTDDSNGPKLDGFTLTTLDSTELSKPGNVTPITGAASTTIKFPWYLSSRVIPGQHARTVSGVQIPGAEGLEYGGLSGVNTSANVVTFWIPFTDGFGNPLATRTLQVAILNRHPRTITGVWTVKFWPKVN